MRQETASLDSLIERVIALQDMTPVFIALYDTQDRLRHANRAFREAFNVAQDAFPAWQDLLRANYEDRKGLIINTKDFDAWLLSAQSRRGKMPFRGLELDLHDGRWIWMTETVQDDGWMLCVGSDITQLRHQRSLRQDRDIAMRAAQTDELTGTANRRYVFSKLGIHIDNVEKGLESPFGLCVMDIDFFKAINDRFGHQGGDAVLREFVKIAHGTIRRSDTFGRVGGEEFMLIMPRTALVDCVDIVNRLLDKVRLSCPFPGAADFSYSCSAGLTLYRAGESSADLYQRVDRALYLAKQKGRARVEWLLE